jgi:peptidoglycan/xylan/chitin deacetylase (PgdA/CDA1 family)
MKPIVPSCLAALALLAHCASNTPAPSSSAGDDGGGGGTASSTGSANGASGSSCGSAASTSGSSSGSGATSSSGSSSGPGAAASSGSTSGSGSGSSGAIGGNGCTGGACLNPTCSPWPAGSKGAAIEPYPTTGFDAQPAFLPKDVIIPTLDDVPDGAIAPPTPAKGAGGWAAMNLAYLDSKKMHWDFFVNTNNDWSSNTCDAWGTSMNATCVAAVDDILKLHNPGNHTMHHWHLGTAATDTIPTGKGCGDAACVKSELLGVETAISGLSKGSRPHLTRFRAPFGEPYEVMGPGYDFVGAAVATFAVSVGWNIDSTDSLYDDGTNCTALNGNSPVATCPTGQDIARAVEALIGTPGTGARYGIVLMHGIFGWTHDALPLLFDPVTGYLAQNKFRVGTVEDAICWKYGMHSWEVVNALNKYSGADARTAN